MGSEMCIRDRDHSLNVPPPASRPSAASSEVPRIGFFALGVDPESDEDEESRFVLLSISLLWVLLCYALFSINLPLLDPCSERTLSPPPAANTFAVEHSASPPQAAPGPVAATTEDATMTVAAASSKEKGIASANVATSSSSSSAWTDHVSTFTCLLYTSDAADD